MKKALIQLPRGGKLPRTVVTVSQKEIFLALLQNGRTTRFNGQSCTAQALIDLDWYSSEHRRIKNDVATAQAIEARLMQDSEPLLNIEPGAAWYFEQNPSPENQMSAGKLLFLEQGVAPDNFVPGD